jgi:hypothetical protein
MSEPSVGEPDKGPGRFRRRRTWSLIGVALVVLLAGLVSAWWFLWVPNWRPPLKEGERYGIDVSAHPDRSPSWIAGSSRRTHPRASRGTSCRASTRSTTIPTPIRGDLLHLSQDASLLPEDGLLLQGCDRDGAGCRLVGRVSGGPHAPVGPPLVPHAVDRSVRLRLDVEAWWVGGAPRVV